MYREAVIQQWIDYVTVKAEGSSIKTESIVMYCDNSVGRDNLLQVQIIIGVSYSTYGMLGCL